MLVLIVIMNYCCKAVKVALKAKEHLSMIANHMTAKKSPKLWKDKKKFSSKGYGKGSTKVKVVNDIAESDLVLTHFNNVTNVNNLECYTGNCQDEDCKILCRLSIMTIS
jgi:hypothetical protein